MNARSEPWPRLRAAPAVYLAFMKWLLLRSVPRLRLLLRALMLVVITGGASGRVAEAGAHCARHSSASVAEPSMALHQGSMAAGASAGRTEGGLALRQPGGGSGLASSEHRCPHCGPAECAAALPCA